MKDIDLVKLKELAQAATPGPWDYNGNCKYGVWSSEEKCYVFTTGTQDDACFTAAANPAVVLTLIEQLEAAQRERDELTHKDYLTWHAAACKFKQRAEAAEAERDEFHQRLANAEHQLEMAELAKFNLRGQRKAQFRKRRAAEAELKRRDEQKPVGWRFKSVNGVWLGLVGEDGKNQAIIEDCEVRPVYAAAPAAATEKVVTLPALEKWRSVDAVRAQGAYRVLVEKELEAAGVKWVEGE